MIQSLITSLLSASEETLTPPLDSILVGQLPLRVETPTERFVCSVAETRKNTHTQDALQGNDETDGNYVTRGTSSAATRDFTIGGSRCEVQAYGAVPYDLECKIACVSLFLE